MGSTDVFHDASPHFDQFINPYQSTIVAMFFGHTHMDQFEISWSDYQAQTTENGASVSYIAPSVSPLSGIPAFRIYTVHPITFGVLDIEIYSADIDAEDFHLRPLWRRTASIREEYGGVNVTRVLETNYTAFDSYWPKNLAPFTFSFKERTLALTLDSLEDAI
ncbi:hypothetical protein ASPACDRAFT_44676 [Aspergillus aculeatus ATCC 16872]|uniref:Calcineurin-like phosphoesterase domain-containing protein n=1 Tax=Aspergillus aculeatus (strain ATCC 16872 / CBS 172.66 / WB 5094) TaxID=690307 RepID=A0A1L9WS69_ASPA1|nr:uncharacterized protein ASPACDRAFT_44676 [Aspergillus aculeatus ATCC 16872]OJJ99045.1 hypothetical protein ASPACDRAFT_44676 [Aspergillus aculeatus ATCC 16872]